MAAKQSWSFDNDESEACDAMLAPPPCVRPSTSNGFPERVWQFKVLMHDDLMANEKMAVVGNCDSLGNWQLSDCVIMSKDEGM